MENTKSAATTMMTASVGETTPATHEKAAFGGDFGLAGIWREFGGALLAKKEANDSAPDEAIKGLEIASSMADDIKKQEKMRKDFVKAFFMREDVRNAIAKFFIVNADRPRQDQVQAITVIARVARPGVDVTLRDLEAQVAEATPETINKNYIRESLIPLMKEIGLIIQPKEGVNGWQWRDVDKKESVKELTQKAFKQVALLSSPVHRELLDEQAKRYALMQQEKVLKQRLLQEKANQQLIMQAQSKADENEKAMIALGMKKPVRNTPAWIASAAVAVIALGLFAVQGGNNQEMNVEQAGVKTYEDAPDYNAITDEELLRLQYQQAGIKWESIPQQDRENLIKELQQERLAAQGESL